MHRFAIFFLFILLSAWGTSAAKKYQEQLYVHRQQFSHPPKYAVALQPVSKPPNLVQAYDVTAQLEDLLQRRKNASKQIKTVPGYIIQVQAHSRQQALTFRNILHTHFSAAKPEVQYSPPTYTVRIGKFLEKLEAFSLYVAIKNYIPKAIIRPITFLNQPYLFTAPQFLRSSQNQPADDVPTVDTDIAVPQAEH